MTSPDGTTRRPSVGEYCRVETEWTDGTALKLSFSPSVELERGYNGSGVLRRGPFIFSLRIDKDWQAVEGEHPEADWAVDPDSTWTRTGRTRTSRCRELTRERPFSPDGAEIEI